MNKFVIYIAVFGLIAVCATSSPVPKAYGSGSPFGLRSQAAYQPRFIDPIGLFARNALSTRIDDNKDDIEALERRALDAYDDLKARIDDLDAQIP